MDGPGPRSSGSSGVSDGSAVRLLRARRGRGNAEPMREGLLARQPDRRVSYSSDGRAFPAGTGAAAVRPSFIEASAVHAPGDQEAHRQSYPAARSYARSEAVNYHPSFEDDRGAAGQLCACVDERHRSRDVLFFLLAVIDAAHVFLTILNMRELGDQVDELSQDTKDTNVKFRIDLCWWMYWVKVGTHFALVFLKMMSLKYGKRGSKIKYKYKDNDLRTLWRHQQDWFVAMTFNSFLMCKSAPTGCCLACVIILTRFPVHGLVARCHQYPSSFSSGHPKNTKGQTMARSISSSGNRKEEQTEVKVQLLSLGGGAVSVLNRILSVHKVPPCLRVQPMDPRLSHLLRMVLHLKPQRSDWFLCTPRPGRVGWVLVRPM